MNEKDSIMEYSLMLMDEEKTNKNNEEKDQLDKKPFEEAAEVLLDN
jgi:hypothetical protein